MNDTRPQNAQVLYWIGTVMIASINGAALAVLLEGEDPNAMVLAVVLANLVVFGFRGVYALRHWRELFKESSFRRAEQATSAERVAVYVFLVILLAVSIQGICDGSGLYIDGSLTELGSLTEPGSLTELGENVMLLAIGAPVVTYLTSGYGQLRCIVHDSHGSSTRSSDPRIS